jgi:hypothetical protein
MEVSYADIVAAEGGPATQRSGGGGLSPLQTPEPGGQRYQRGNALSPVPSAMSSSASLGAFSTSDGVESQKSQDANKLLTTSFGEESSPRRVAPAGPVAGKRTSPPKGSPQQQARIGGPPTSETVPKKPPNPSQNHVIDINRALRVLEQRAWDALQCSCPEEVVQKLLCSECHAALDSAVAFATDQNCIWMPMQDISDETGNLLGVYCAH